MRTSASRKATTVDDPERPSPNTERVSIAYVARRLDTPETEGPQLGVRGPLSRLRLKRGFVYLLMSALFKRQSR